MVIVSSTWMQNPSYCTLNSIWFKGFNGSIRAINITVSTMQKGPELQILNRAPASSWGVQRSRGALEVSEVISHLSIQHSS